MSRTDVHRPWWVLERDPYMRRDFVPHHNHWIRDDWDPELHRWLVRLTAPCDLAERLAGPVHVHTRCGLGPSGRRRFCSCHLCTGQPGRKLARRQERGWWRNTRRELLAAVDREDVDVAAVRGKAW